MVRSDTDGFQDDLAAKRAVYQAFVDLADPLLDDADVKSRLNRLARHCASWLDVAAANIMLADEHGTMKIVTTSDQQDGFTGLHQIHSTMQDPSVECYDTGTAVTATDSDDSANRWPGFVAEARKRGIRAAHALPMRRHENVIGTLNLYSTDITRPSAGELILAQALAEAATLGILQGRTRRRNEAAIQQLQHALDSRVIIEQAKGVLANHGNLTVDAAFARLRQYARSHSQRVHDVAHQVVSDPTHAGHIIQAQDKPRT